MGGIVCFAQMNENYIINCKNKVNVMSKKNKSDVGGIVGSERLWGCSLYIDRCANFGNITGCYSYGICRYGNIKNSYNEGTIESDQLMYAAGIGNGGIYNCYNKGKIISISDISPEESSIYSVTGGIYGYIENGSTSLNIVNCYNTGELSSRWVKGSIIGQVRVITPTTLNCFYLQRGYSREYDQTTPYTEQQLKNESFIEELNNYIESNSDGIDTTGWAKWIKGADGYPTLDFSIIWDGSKWVNS